MAQGQGVKKGKSSKFVLPSKAGSSSKGNKLGGTKKGVKKSKGNKEGNKIKKNLQKAIGRRIEEELVTVASDKGTNFKILNSSAKSKKKTTK